MQANGMGPVMGAQGMHPMNGMGMGPNMMGMMMPQAAPIMQQQQQPQQQQQLQQGGFAQQQNLMMQQQQQQQQQQQGNLQQQQQLQQQLQQQQLQQQQLQQQQLQQQQQQKQQQLQQQQMMGQAPFAFVPNQNAQHMQQVPQAGLNNSMHLNSSVRKSDDDDDDDDDKAGRVAFRHAPPAEMTRPCTHNDWDDVRTRKGAKILRCRVCQSKWKLPSARVPRCSPFLSGHCEKYVQYRPTFVISPSHPTPSEAKLASWCTFTRESQTCWSALSSSGTLFCGYVSTPFYSLTLGKTFGSTTTPHHRAYPKRRG